MNYEYLNKGEFVYLVLQGLRKVNFRVYLNRIKHILVDN